jgi:uncharacterized membrane protein
MTTPEPIGADVPLERFLGRWLRIGVLSAAVVVLAGGVLFLNRYGDQPTGDREFHGEPTNLRSPVGIVRGALALHSRALIQFGLMLLIATPVARVVFSVFAFARQRDYTYLVVTCVVLAILICSLFSSHW